MTEQQILEELARKQIQEEYSKFIADPKRRQQWLYSEDGIDQPGPPPAEGFAGKWNDGVTDQRTPKVKTAAEIDGRPIGGLAKPQEDFLMHMRNEAQGQISKYDALMKDLFKPTDKPKFDDLKDDLNAKEEYTQEDTVKMALMGILPALAGGLIGGLPGAVGASEAGPRGIERFMKAKSEGAKSRRESAEKRAKSRIDIYKQDVDANYKNQSLLLNQALLEQKLLGKVTDFTNKMIAQNMGIDAAQAFNAPTAQANIDAKTAQTELNEKKYQLDADKMGLEQQKLTAQIQKIQNEMENANKDREIKLQGLQQQYEIAKDRIDQMAENNRFSKEKAEAALAENARQFNEKQKALEAQFQQNMQFREKELRQRLDELESKLKSQEGIAKGNNETRKGIADAAAAAKGGKGGKGGPQKIKLDAASETTVKKLALLNSGMTQIKNMMRQSYKQLIDPKKSTDEKIIAGQELLKVINSPLGADAIGKEESERLGALLQFQKGNLFGPGNFVGRDLKGFTKQVFNNITRLDGAVKANQAEIDRIYAAAGGSTATSGAPTKSGLSREEKIRLLKARGYK